MSSDPMSALFDDDVSVAPPATASTLPPPPPPRRDTVRLGGERDADDDDEDDSFTAPSRRDVNHRQLQQPTAGQSIRHATSEETDAAGVQGGVQLDLAFCCDCTGSMGAYIRSAQDNIRNIAQSIFEQKGQSCSIRFALVKYRDHPPQDTTFITEVYPFTKSLDVMKSNVDTMSASGGGDGPEAVTAALHEVNELGWRPNASKVCVFIADAPPHGLGESGDGFPDGCPMGYDPVAICRSLAEKGVVVYAIGVEPVLSTQYKYARDFMMMVASVTEGKFLPLGKADILAKVIVSTAIEGLELATVTMALEEEVKQEAAKAGQVLSADQLCEQVEQRIASKKSEIAVQKIAVESPYMADYDDFNVEQFAKATTLAEARSKLSSTRNAEVKHKSASYAWGQQQAQVEVDMCMDMEQCSRATRQVQKRNGLWK